MSPVRFWYSAPICSHSIKALHYIGNVETQDRYPVGAPISAFSSMNRILGFEPRDVGLIPARLANDKYIKGDCYGYH